MGSSPMTAPGNGAGNTAAAVQALKGMFPMALKLLSAFTPGSDDFSHMQDIVKSMNKIVGKEQDSSSVPSAIRQMALAAQGGGMKSAPPIAVQPAAANQNIQSPQEPEPV